MNTPIDPSAIATLREVAVDDPAFLRDLIDVFLQATPPLLAQIAQAIDARDSILLERAAHTIKGSAANFGAANLVRLALAAETHGRAGEFAEAAGRLPALRAEYERVAQALRQYR